MHFTITKQDWDEALNKVDTGLIFEYCYNCVVAHVMNKQLGKPVDVEQTRCYIGEKFSGVRHDFPEQISKVIKAFDIATGLNKACDDSHLGIYESLPITFELDIKEEV